MQKLIFTNDVVLALRDEIAAAEADKVFVLADKNTVRRVVPLLHIDSAIEIVEVAAGDGNKTLDAVAGVWKILTEKGATRRSLLVNVGGGMVTDLPLLRSRGAYGLSICPPLCSGQSMPRWAGRPG